MHNYISITIKIIDAMIRYNITRAKVSVVGELLISTNLITRMLQNQIAIHNGSRYHFDNLTDLNSWEQWKFDTGTHR